MTEENKIVLREELEDESRMLKGLQAMEFICDKSIKLHNRATRCFVIMIPEIVVYAIDNPRIREAVLSILKS